MRIALVAVCVFASGTPLAAQDPLLERSEMNSKTHALVLNAPREKVFGFLSKVENLPKWAVEFCRGVEKRGSQWWVTTPDGPLLFRIDADARTGVLDMSAGPTPEQMQPYPARVFALPDGRSLFLFTAIQYPGTTDEVFQAQCTALVEHEFPELKRQVE